MYFSILLAGFFGGVVRGLVGFLKHYLSYKNVKFELWRFLGTSFLSGIIGLMTAAAVREIGFDLQTIYTPALSFVIGYAGGDFIQSVYKIIAKGIFSDKK
ncbi:MAG: hypothetical protein HQ539_00965 [Parcubacteria group bacterium]|nr:hypothetical protein [Parcubacteria group bacterium]